MRKLLTPFLFSSLSAMFLISCGNQPATDVAVQPAASFNLDSLKKVIVEKDKAFTKAFVNGDSAAVMNAYTTDARLFPPNAEMIVGRQAMGPLLSQFFKYGIKEFSDSTTAFYGNEENLIEEGTLFMGDGKGHVIDKGKYIEIWKKENGEWKICADIWNTSLPPAPAKK